ncbi:MAG: hypothetical protein CML23_11670 [Rhizobiaceae bacterium]|nr:hypothetical protein [Rhizobiaceae bacterium]
MWRLNLPEHAVSYDEHIMADSAGRQGKINAAIAAEIGLSPRTVEAHRLRLIHTLGLANSDELLAWFLNSEQ